MTNKLSYFSRPTHFFKGKALGTRLDLGTRLSCTVPGLICVAAR